MRRNDRGNPGLGRVVRRVGMALTLVAVGPLAGAAGLQFSAGVEAGYEHTSNLYRTPQAPESAEFATGTGRIMLVDQTRTLYADVEAVGRWFDFPEGTPGSDFRPAADVFVMWTPVADTFGWRFTDSLGEIAANANGGLAPADRERVNVFSTGPDLRLPLGAGSYFFTAGARYSRADYENSPTDSDRLAGQAGLARELDSGALLSFNVLHERTEQDATGTDYDVSNVFLNYMLGGARGALDASVGVSRLSSGGDEPTGAFADIRLVRDLNASLSLAVDLVHRFGDAAAVFGRRQDLEPDIGSIANVQVTGQALRETAGDVGLAFTGRRTVAALAVSHYRERTYGGAIAATDRNGTDLAATVDFTLRPDFVIGADAVQRWWEDATSSSARASELRGRVTWQFIQRLGLSVGAEHYEQSNTNQDYTETRYFARLAWQFTRGEVTRQRPGFDAAARRRIQYGR